MKEKEGPDASGVNFKILIVRSVSLGANKDLSEIVVVPMVSYGAETWDVKVPGRNKVAGLEMELLRSMCGVTSLDRVRK